MELISNLPPSVQSSIEMMMDQRRKGIATYGQGIEDAALSSSQLLRHAREEAADASVYLAQLQEQFSREMMQNYERGMRDLFGVLESLGALGEDLPYARSIMETACSGMYHAPVHCYAAPDALNAWAKDGVNLLTVCRTRNAAFTTSVQVIP